MYEAQVKSLTVTSETQLKEIETLKKRIRKLEETERVYTDQDSADDFLGDDD